MNRDGPDGTGAFDRELQALSDQVRFDDAVSARRQKFVLSQMAAESGTLLGTIVDLAEAGTAVVFTIQGNRSPRGHVVAVGTDFVALRAANRQLSFVSVDAVSTVQPEPGAVPPAGDRVIDRATSLLGALDTALEDNQPVAVHTRSGTSVTGVLVAVGSDVLTVRTATGRSVYVARSGVTEVTLS